MNDHRRPCSLTSLPWPRVAEHLARDPRLIFPVGALEQHGPHLPLGANLAIVGAVADAVSAAVGVLTAPVFPYGVNVRWGRSFPGAAGLRRKSLHRTVNELIAQWEDQGIQDFTVLTAHRYEPHLDALLMSLASKAETRVVNLYDVDIGDLLEHAPQGEHAGELETSLLLHLDPDLVAHDRVRDVRFDEQMYRRYVRGGMPTAPGDWAGVAGHPAAATADKGARAFERIVEFVVAELASAGSSTRSRIDATRPVYDG